MGEIAIYVPDELEKGAAEAGIDIADTAHQAVTQAVYRAEAYQAATADLRRVAERLAATDPAEARRLGAYRDGADWARETATLTQLRALADTADPGPYLPAGTADQAGVDPAAYQEEWTQGALDVYEQVEPLLG